MHTQPTCTEDDWHAKGAQTLVYSCMTESLVLLFAELWINAAHAQSRHHVYVGRELHLGRSRMKYHVNPVTQLRGSRWKYIERPVKWHRDRCGDNAQVKETVQKCIVGIETSYCLITRTHYGGLILILLYSFWTPAHQIQRNFEFSMESLTNICLSGEWGPSTWFNIKARY